MIELDFQTDEVEYRFADRFALQQAWQIASQLAWRHPDLALTSLEDPDGHQLLVAHYPANPGISQRVQFDLMAGALWVDGTGEFERLSYLDIFAQHDPFAAVAKVEFSADLGPAVDSAGPRPRALVYRLIAQILADRIDDGHTWLPTTYEQQSHQTGGMPRDAAAILQSLRGFATGMEAFHEYEAVLSARAAAVRQSAEDGGQGPGVFYWKEPLWFVTKDMEPLVVLDEAGFAHLSSGERIELSGAYQALECDLSALAALVTMAPGRSAPLMAGTELASSRSATQIPAPQRPAAPRRGPGSDSASRSVTATAPARGGPPASSPRPGAAGGAQGNRPRYRLAGSAQRGRALGVLMGTAAGDALGAPYEFGPSLPAETPVTMHAGGVWEKGEWTDDTAMALAIAQVAAQGLDLRDEEAQDGIVQRWIEWAFDPKTKDVGIQTRHVLSSANRHGGTAAAARRAAEKTHARQGKSGGNGSLMRTAPVALAYLGDEAALTEAAQAIARLTHYERDNGDACVLWCHAIRHAVLTGELDARVGLPHISADRRDYWAARLDDAEQHDPAHFSHNGWVVEALQGAWSAIKRTPVPREDPPGGRFRADHLRLALENAVRGGRDTDTVAAIAGGLLGATWGVAAVPALWRADLHGWPGLRPHDLDQLTQAITGGGAARRARDYSDVPRQPLVKLPRDPGVLLGNVQAALHPSGADFDAVVSLCEIAPDLRAARPWIEVFLIDKADPDANQQLGFVLEDTVRAISQLRDDGHRVLLHCVYAQSRTPTVAALYTMRRFGVDESTARHEVQAALGGQFSGNEAFREALRKADGAPQGGGAGLRVP